MSVDQGLSALVIIIIPTSGATRNLLFVGAVEKRPLASAQERCLPACEERALAPWKSDGCPAWKSGALAPRERRQQDGALAPDFKLT